MYKFGQRSLSRLSGVNPQLIECAKRALAKSQYDMTVPWMGGLRTEEEQNEIFKEGNSKCDGYKVKSYHQSGNAIDLIPVEKGYKNTRGLNHFARVMMSEWQSMLINGEAEGIMIWGGTFGSNSWDRPHFEVRK